jgi:hypothetical protein
MVQFAAMTPEHAIDIEGRRAELFGDRDHFGGHHKQEEGRRIDEATDQPGAGDAVDFRAFARHPEGSTLGVAPGQLGCRDARQPALDPSRKATLQGLRGYAGIAQQRGHPCAEPKAVRTDHDDRPAAKLGRPIESFVMDATNGTGHKARIDGEFLVRSHVNKRRASGRTDQTHQSVGRY